MQLSPKAVCKQLDHIDDVDTVDSATYREQAIAVLADMHVSLKWRQAVANRLDEADHRLAIRTVDSDDSY
ncbi:MAG: hypothetical protein AAFX01_02310 [Cyanobacteria bacterium J06638_28]